MNFLPVFLTAVFVAALAYFSPVANTNSDPRFGLLVSQAILQHHTVRMEVYEEAIAPIKDQSFVTYGGHTYYYFPLGTPLFSLPAVWTANRLGLDMTDGAHEAAAQNAISAVVVGLSFLTLFYLCSIFLPIQTALLLTATVFLGSALISTMSTALWSIDFAVLFVSLSLFLLARQAKGQAGPFAPYFLGFFLFAAYLCRPSTFLFVGLVIVYLWLADRKSFWRTATFSLGLLLVFLLFIRLTYAAWLPPYYNEIGRLAVERRPLWEALAGILVSPSRGLFIYSPFFLLTLAGSAVYFNRLKKQSLFWLIVTWLILHLLLVARTTRWWGGASFGPRILAEALPGLILLTALIGQIFWERPFRRTRQRWPVAFLFGGLAAWAIFLNSYQALFNPYTAWWNGVLPPIVDYQPEYLWNWNYPQFLADNEMLCRRNREYMEQVLEKERVRLAMSPYFLGSSLSVLEGMPLRLYELANLGDLPAGGEMDEALMFSPQTSSFLPLVVQDGDKGMEALLAGWSNPDESYRWSMCQSTMIAFKLDGEVEKGRPYDLWILSSSFGEQRVIVWLNGEQLGPLTFNAPPNSPDAHNLIIPAGLLKPGEINQLVFELPDAVIPELPNENRRLGLAFVSFGIRTFP